MSEKKIPQRKCLGCNEMKDKFELIRVVKNQLGEVKLDPTGKANGRGAYVCKNVTCLEKAQKSRRLEKTFKMAISEEVYKMLKGEIARNE